MNKFMKAQKKIEEAVASGYKAIENGVVSGYKKMEDGVVGSYKKIEDKFTNAFLTPDADSAAATGKEEGGESPSKEDSSPKT